MHYLSLNKKSSQPYYQQIEESIESAIKNRVINHNDRLATVAEVAEFFDVSIMAPRKAYDLLEAKGIVYSVKGRGTFVNARPLLVIPLESFYRAEHFVPDKNWQLKSYISYFDQIREATELLVQTHLNDYPVSYHTYQFVVPVDEVRLKSHRNNVFDLHFIHTLIQDDVATMETDFIAKSATPLEARILQIENKDPIIRLSSKSYSATGELLYTSENYYPSAYVHFESRN